MMNIPDPITEEDAHSLLNDYRGMLDAAIKKIDEQAHEIVRLEDELKLEIGLAEWPNGWEARTGRT